MTTSILWLRRDLRVHDHPALGPRSGGRADVPVFCFDDALLERAPRLRAADPVPARVPGRPRRGAARARQPAVRAPRPPEREIARARPGDWGPRRCTSAPTSARSPGAATRPRGGRCARDGVDARRAPGLFALDTLEPMRTGPGSPYTVFTPFYRTWLRRPRRPTCRARREHCRRPAAGRSAARCPRSRRSGSSRSVTPAPGGERAARRALADFLRGPVDDYADGRDTLSGRSVSRLSPYLHFGCVSPREIEQRLGDGGGRGAVPPPALLARLLRPRARSLPPQRALTSSRRAIAGRSAGATRGQRFEAWCEGRTGYPAVDAGMRQLRREGWMHNRARLLVGSFLTKDLGIDWRWGERWFMRLLLDGDEAVQQRQLAVDRVGRRRPGAGVPADLQPDAPAAALRPRRRLRARVRARAARTSRTSIWPNRGRWTPRTQDAAAVASARTTPSRSSTTPGAPGGARPLSRLTEAAVRRSAGLHRESI